MKVVTQRVYVFDDGSELIAPQHVEDFVRLALDRGMTHPNGSLFIDAIKFLRAEFGLDLKNAKDLVNYWRGPKKLDQASEKAFGQQFEQPVGELVRKQQENAA